MGSTEPIPGRCGATNVDGTYCSRYPPTGKKRCPRHGSGTKENPGGRPIVHGRYSERFRREGKKTQELIDSALQDPGLLDARRPAALQQILIEEVRLVPDEDLIWDLAISLIPASVRKALIKAEKEIEPSDALLDRARRMYVMQSMVAVETYQKAVASAAKQVAVGELVSAELLPLFDRLGAQLRRLNDRYIPEDKRDEYDADFRRIVRSVVLEAATAGDK